MARFAVSHALNSLCPGAQWSMTNEEYSSIDWVSTDIQQPSLAAVNAEIARLNAEWEATAYQRSRAVEYPSIGDQLDALFHAGVFPTEMAAQIQAIKDKYPKV